MALQEICQAVAHEPGLAEDQGVRLVGGNVQFDIRQCGGHGFGNLYRENLVVLPVDQADGQGPLVQRLQRQVDDILEASGVETR